MDSIDSEMDVASLCECQGLGMLQSEWTETAQSLLYTKELLAQSSEYCSGGGRAGLCSQTE